MATVVKKADFNNLKVLKNGVDVVNLQKYADYIDPPAPESRQNKAEFSWVKTGEAKIIADVKEGEGIVVQVSFDPGWKASIQGTQVPIKKDVIGFMFIDPGKTGNLEIKLNYGKTWDVWLGYIITLLAILGLINYGKLMSKLFKPENQAEEQKELNDEK